MKHGGKALGAAGVLALVIGGFQLWGYVQAQADRAKARIEAEVTRAAWANRVEERLCKLEGGRMFRGDCVYRRRDR